MLSRFPCFYKAQCEIEKYSLKIENARSVRRFIECHARNTILQKIFPSVFFFMIFRTAEKGGLKYSEMLESTRSLKKFEDPKIFATMDLEMHAKDGVKSYLQNIDQIPRNRIVSYFSIGVSPSRYIAGYSKSHVS